MNGSIEYGIDLGTTNSCISRWQGGDLRIFQNNAQMNVTPSAVHVRKSGQILVGPRAISVLASDPDNVAVEFKRWMGQGERKQFPASDKEFSAEELSAEVLKSLIADVRRLSGDEVDAAVITVPAAFGALQCEATSRAAQLAGLVEAPLLQEPIAAAIGYGANPSDAAQKWLVFDLGGGTLDIAVVSTRDGRLSVLDHRGDNLMGGKDFDRAIIDSVLMPALDATYELRSRSSRGALIARLRAKAEEVKIDLSRESQVIISLWDIGEDDTGKPIELDVSMTRRQLETISEPLLERCCGLADQALAGARIGGADLDRILLVGGPTQSPIVRAYLEQRLGARVDISADPMTVVCRGAALYASTYERSPRHTATNPAASDAPGAKVGGGNAKEVELRLAFDAVSADLEPVVTGRVMGGPSDVEVRIDAASGEWTSGWMRPAGGVFETSVRLPTGDVGVFWVYARDAAGQALQSDIVEFKIRHGLAPASPPLPHTMWVELVGAGGEPELKEIFARATPLPAERTDRFRADHAVLPSDPASGLSIKLWEGEFQEDAEANEWVGQVIIGHDDVGIGLRAGEEIELTFRIDASRLIHVEGFAGQARARFEKPLYAAEREEQHFTRLAEGAGRETDEYRGRLEALGEVAVASADEASVIELEALQRDLDALDAKLKAQGDHVEDPDDSRRVVAEAKAVRGRLSRLEMRLSGQYIAPTPIQFASLIETTDSVVTDFGAPIDQQQLAVLKRQLERSVERGDTKGVQRIVDEISAFRWRVLYKQDWFWREIFEGQRRPDVQYADPAEAARLFISGQAAVASGDGQTLRRIVRSLWDLQPKTSEEASRERALASGLRRF